jgi:hypothetical protein
MWEGRLAGDLMGLAQYQIVSHGDEWDILHDGEVKHTP